VSVDKESSEKNGPKGILHPPLCLSQTKRAALLLVKLMRGAPIFRLALDGKRRMRVLRKALGPEIHWEVESVKSGLGKKRVLLLTRAFKIPIDSLLCMQANPLSPPPIKAKKDLLFRDMFYFQGMPREKVFFGIENTISYVEICAALKGEDYLRDFLSKIDRFGPDWAKDREPRTLYLVAGFKNSPAFLDFDGLVSVLSDGSLVLQDGHHRASLAKIAGQEKISVRLKA